MRIVFHVGAHCTDGERLLRSLMRNADLLADHGVKVPGPGKYRRLLRETIQGLGDGVPQAGAREVLIDAILDNDTAGRMVLSNPAFFCTPTRIFEDGRFYGMAEAKLTALAALFPGDGIEIALATRNPATFVPAVWAQVKGRAFGKFLGGLDPRAIRWSELIERIATTLPGMRLTVWSNEDTPLIWAELLRRLAGVDRDVPLQGAHDLLATIMSEAGMRRFLTYLDTHPPQSEAQLRRVISAFLDKYALAEEIEEEVDLPGWDAALIEDLTTLYEADLDLVAAMDTVDFITP